MKKKTLQNFYEGIDCSQVVAGNLQKNWGSHRKKHIRMAAGFGGGMGIGETCGAVVGAMIVLGMKYGHFDTEHMEQKDIMNVKRAEFLEKFGKKYDSCSCKGLLKHDIADPEEMQKILEKAFWLISARK